MISWIALIVGLISLAFASYIYLYGTRVELLTAEDMFDGLLEENDGNYENESRLDDELET